MYSRLPIQNYSNRTYKHVILKINDLIQLHLELYLILSMEAEWMCT